MTDGYTLVVVGENRVAFSNNTQISINGGTTYPYKVFNSNGMLNKVSTSKEYVEQSFHSNGTLCRGLFRVLILRMLSVIRIIPLRMLTPA